MKKYERLLINLVATANDVITESLGDGNLFKDCFEEGWGKKE